MPTIKDERLATTMFPLIATKGSVGFDSIRRDQTKDLINSHLKMLLLTNPGELISDSNFGVGLYQILFLNELEDRVTNLRRNITSQISTYLGYLSKYRVIVDKSKMSNNQLGVRIEYKIGNELEINTITFIASGGSVTVYNSPEVAATATTPAIPSIPMTLEQILDERT